MLKNSCPGSKEIKQPKPEDIGCQHCGKVIEIWSDEIEVRCKYCGNITIRPLGVTCLDWCAFAKECIGEEKYRKLKK